MTESLKIAIAEDEPDRLYNLANTLTRMGHTVTSKATTGQELVEQCHNQPPDLIVTDIKLPGMDGLEAVALCRKEHPIPVVIVSAFHDSQLLERALKEHVMAFLVKPISEQSLKTSITIAMQRFKEFQALLQQTSDLQEALEERKIIERAKGIIMRRGGLNEQDAFRRLQLLSSQRNEKLIQVARTILSAEEAFKP